MKRPDPSTFPANVDKDQNDNDAGFGFLLIAGIIAVGFFSVLAELLTSLGWIVPHVLSLGAGLFLGIVIGVLAASSIRSINARHDS
jgi:hypothetical protein